MQTSNQSFWLRSLLVTAIVILGWTTYSSTAFAFGSLRLKRTTIEEADGRWKFDAEVNYGSKPHLGHVPFDFIFVQNVYYEYSITDSDSQPVQRRKPMHNQAPQREQMDIGFADARGDTWPRTKFSFSLRRDRGFSAGEYTLTVKRSSDGQTLGRPMKIVLNGQNELIDRRAIVFAGEPTKKKKAPKAEEKAGEASESRDEPEDTVPEDTVPEDVEPSDDLWGASGPPSVEKRANGTGCGCRMVGMPGSQGGLPALGWLLAAVVFGWYRRRD